MKKNKEEKVKMSKKAKIIMAVVIICCVVIGGTGAAIYIGYTNSLPEDTDNYDDLYQDKKDVSVPMDTLSLEGATVSINQVKSTELWAKQEGDIKEIRGDYPGAETKLEEIQTVSNNKKIESLFDNCSLLMFSKHKVENIHMAYDITTTSKSQLAPDLYLMYLDCDLSSLCSEAPVQTKDGVSIWGQFSHSTRTVLETKKETDQFRYEFILGKENSYYYVEFYFSGFDRSNRPVDTTAANTLAEVKEKLEILMSGM